MMGIRGSDQRNKPAARAFALLAALLAVFVHAFVVQPHVHIAPQALTSALHEDAANSRPAQAADVHVINADHQAFCAVCEVLATAGQMAPPEAYAAVATFVAIQQAASFAIGIAPFALTHSWRSRAPPIVL